MRLIFCIASWALVASTGFADTTLTDQQLFDAINLEYPGLQQVKADMATTNLPAAKADLTSYLKTRTNVTYFFDWHNPTTAISFNLTSANQATNATVSQVGYTYTFPNYDIDWWYNYTTNLACSCAKNNEWQWTLNRMGFWPNLGTTYWGTRIEDYPIVWSRQFRDWIDQCPAATNRMNGAPSTWRTIESGLRMNSYWPDTFFRMLLSPSLTNSEHVLYMKSCYEHGRYLTNWYTSGTIAPANFLTMEMNGLYTVGATFPELKEATGWRVFAGQKMRAEQTNQFLPDGVQNELTPRYHGVAVGNILNIYDLAATNNLAAELPIDYVSNMEKSYDYYAAISTPERTTPAFNDASRENVRSWLADGLHYFPNRADFQWFASNGASGAPPAYVSYRFPWAGYGVMRSSWASNANYLCFDAGALGYSGHRHQDKLNLVLWGYGREFLLDNGGGPYDSSIWRTWGQSTYSHNCIIVDGLQQQGGDGSATLDDPDYVAQAPIDIRWESDPNHDFAAGVYNRGYGSYTSRPASQTRRVLFVKPDLFVVADTLVPTNSASHTYQARWNLRLTNTLYFPDTKTVVSTDAGRPNLAIVPCLGASLAATNISMQTSTVPGVTNLPDILGWDLPDTSSKLNPATTVTHTLTGVTTQQFLTLFMPLQAGVTNPVVLVSNTGPTSADVWLNDGRRLQLYADPNPARGLKFAEVLPGGTTNRYVGAGFVPPTVTGLTNRYLNPNTSKLISFTVADADSTPANVALSAHSLDQSLIPDSGLVLSGTSSNRQLSITPAPGRSGTTTIGVTATDPDGSTITPTFTVTVNGPTFTNGFVANTWEEQPCYIDLATTIGDDLTPAGNIIYAITNTTGGRATFLPDGRMIYFEPATNFSGTATLQVVTTDTGYDPRLLLYYSFEVPDDLSRGLISDLSDNLRPGSLGYAGSGVATLDGDVPAALGPANHQSLRLTEVNTTNTAQLNRLISTNDFNFSDHDWTFSGWFKRASLATEDFVLHLGNGDGFGSEEEVQLHGLAGSSALQLRHYIGETNMDVFLSVSNINAGEWHHAAVTFVRTNSAAGILSLYVDGAFAGAGMVPRFNLDQTVPAVFGGHNRTNSRPERWFNGWLDDLGLFTAALSPQEISNLTQRTIGNNAGLTATNLVSVFVRDINDPPLAMPGSRATGKGQLIDIDLRSYAFDIETPANLWRFSVSGATNGTVTLLADGHTARFTPLNQDCYAGFRFSVTDNGVDPRALLHYSFEPPDSAADNLASDNTGNGNDGVLSAFSSGLFNYVTNVPGTLSLFDSTSLQLVEIDTNSAARLSVPIPQSTLNLSDHDWTFAGWFRRTAQTNEDFFFYIGNGDGFGANEELQLYGYPGANKITVRHYIGSSLTDADLSASPVNVGEWHHAGLSFTRTNSNSGILRLYLDGNLAGTAYPHFNLDQTVPIVFGGHNSLTYGIWRWFGGQLDDLALFSAALTQPEIARLATDTVSHLGGLSATNFVTIAVGSPNHPPVFNSQANFNSLAGRTLLVTNRAQDPDVPPQDLLYSLLAGPAGAALNPSNGVLSWRPAISQSGTEYPINVVATENGWSTNQVWYSNSARLSATQSYRISVQTPARPMIGSLTLSNGLPVLNVSGDAGPDYVLQINTNIAGPYWLPTWTNPFAVPPFWFTDPQATNAGQRYYRIQLQP